MSDEQPVEKGRTIVPVTPVPQPIRDNGDSIPFSERGHHVIPMTPLPPPDRSDE
jgi:hypothetical protein